MFIKNNIEGIVVTNKIITKMINNNDLCIMYYHNRYKLQSIIIHKICYSNQKK